MIDVSIVFGTYNRLNYLKDCVQSIRDSVDQLRYEIIIVDGGSKDGTRNWLLKQKDIVSIFDRGLEGAVKAFNKGFRIAQGKYVANLNDDLVVVDNAVQTMHEYMENHPRCGQGAFYFKREGEVGFRIEGVFGRPYANFGRQGGNWATHLAGGAQIIIRIRVIPSCLSRFGEPVSVWTESKTQGCLTS